MSAYLGEEVAQEAVGVEERWQGEVAAGEGPVGLEEAGEHLVHEVLHRLLDRNTICGGNSTHVAACVEGTSVTQQRGGIWLNFTRCK